MKGGINMKFKRISTILIALTMTACITSCGDKNEDKSSSKSSAIEAQTAELSTVDTTEKVETTTIDEIQKALEEQKKAESQETNQSGLQKHTNRKEKGYYLEDYITINFTGYEHDSEVEVIVDWDKLASDLGNDISPDILEQVYRISVLNTDDMALDHSKVNDLINGDEVSIHMSEHTLQSNFKQKYSKELKYIDENVWYYEDTPAFVSGLKSKSFIPSAAPGLPGKPISFPFLRRPVRACGRLPTRTSDRGSGSATARAPSDCIRPWAGPARILSC